MVSETRADADDINEDMERRVKQIIKSSAEMHGLREETKIIGKGTTISCDHDCVSVVMEEAKKIKGFHTVKEMKLANGGEDASFLIKRVQEHGGKGTYMIIGTPISAPHHHQKFDIDEAAIPLSVDLLERIALRELK